MAGGFFQGIAIGSAIAVGGAVVLSMFVGLPNRLVPIAPPAQVPAQDVEGPAGLAVQGDLPVVAGGGDAAPSIVAPQTGLEAPSVETDANVMVPAAVPRPDVPVQIAEPKGLEPGQAPEGMSATDGATVIARPVAPDVPSAGALDSVQGIAGGAGPAVAPDLPEQPDVAGLVALPSVDLPGDAASGQEAPASPSVAVPQLDVTGLQVPEPRDVIAVQSGMIESGVAPEAGTGAELGSVAHSGVRSGVVGSGALTVPEADSAQIEVPSSRAPVAVQAEAGAGQVAPTVEGGVDLGSVADRAVRSIAGQAVAPVDVAQEAVPQVDAPLPLAVEAAEGSDEADEPETVTAPAVRRLAQAVRQEPTAPHRIGTPATSMVDRVQAVSVRRPEAEVAEDEVAAEQTPLAKYAVPVEVSGDQPRLSVVLAHMAMSDVSADDLKDLPFALTVAVDTALPNAGEVMQGYREAGVEVLALVDIPEATQGVDADAALRASLARVPESVAVVEGLGDGVQGSSEISRAVTDALAETGHGLLLQSTGLNTTTSLAARAGVPSARLLKAFDDGTRDARTMRRFLDQAAFRVRQDGSGVVLGVLRRETLDALLVWGTDRRAAQVNFVPASNILSGAIGG